MKPEINEIKFNKIEYENVFTDNFIHLTENNTIDFSDKNAKDKIIVIYGPNGTGKTSLSKILSGTSGDLEFTVNGIDDHNQADDVFFVISDQNNRNIISGHAEDFIIGDNIKREAELEFILERNIGNFKSEVDGILKRNKINNTKHRLITEIEYNDLKKFLAWRVNNKTKNNTSIFNIEQITSIFNSLPKTNSIRYDQERLDFLINDYSSGKESIIAQIETLATMTLTPNTQAHEIEENNEAINILNRFAKDQCIVCDSNIDHNALLARKKENFNTIIQKLEPEAKSLIEQICRSPITSDPFQIKQSIIQTIEKGNPTILENKINEINEGKNILISNLQNDIIDAYFKCDIADIYYEYSALVRSIPAISDDDFNYIKLVVDNCMEKQLDVRRDENRKLRITLSDKPSVQQLDLSYAHLSERSVSVQEILGESREKLHLSTGEQNFLSLTFEFLRAKNSKSPIVVIDDPISSFDSIYKNKVAYAIVKLMQNKKIIVLTHNVDLIRLLNGQKTNCFNLYYFNNTNGELNGFIPFKSSEQEMLISLEKLLSAVRNKIPTKVKNIEVYLIAMIPFMRGYAHIIGNNDVYKNLTEVMHGYKTKAIDIADAYIQLFDQKRNFITSTYCVSAGDIIAKAENENSEIEIIDKTEYPLLNRTLNHSFQYLYLRMIVEKVLVNKFNVKAKDRGTLGQIINKALEDPSQIKNRIRLTSKKTLLNEFNHFEGNLSIFQPAIDITNSALQAEKYDIMKFVNEINKI